MPKQSRNIMVNDRCSDLAIKQNDRMDIAFLLLKLKHGDPALVNSFSNKLFELAQ
jgi:hypothetical protein